MLPELIAALIAIAISMLVVWFFLDYLPVKVEKIKKNLADRRLRRVAASASTT